MSDSRSVMSVSQASEQRSRLIWSGVIVSLLGLQVFGCLLGLFLATSSDSMAVIPNYHDKAIRWDEHRLALFHSDQLGWNVELEVSPPLDLFANRSITIRLHDTQSQPISVDQLCVQAYRHRNPGEVFTMNPGSTAPGEYVAELRMTGSGLWELEIEAVRGTDRFVASYTIELQQEGPGLRRVTQ